MPRAHLALIALLSLIASPAMAQTNPMPESGSDATTPMDRKAGNLAPPTDNTLSNQEVEHLQNPEGTMEQRQTTGAMGTVTGGGIAPSVSGSTAIYKQKGDSAAQSEGGVVGQGRQ